MWPVICSYIITHKIERLCCDRSQIYLSSLIQPNHVSCCWSEFFLWPLIKWKICIITGHTGICDHSYNGKLMLWPVIHNSVIAHKIENPGCHWSCTSYDPSWNKNIDISPVICTHVITHRAEIIYCDRSQISLWSLIWPQPNIMSDHTQICDRS